MVRNVRAAPASPRLVSDWLHNPLPKCGLLMGVAAGLGEGQGEGGAEGLCDPGSGRDRLSLRS